MKNPIRHYAAMIVSAVLIACASQASAQSNAARDAAIHKCMVKVVSEYPRSGSDDNDSARTAAYKSCMATAGLNP